MIANKTTQDNTPSDTEINNLRSLSFNFKLPHISFMKLIHSDTNHNTQTELQILVFSHLSF